jgi:L-ascorbate metabolism protein UlaG (beta-lactamase superfamily)
MIYHAGDTAVFGDMKIVGELYSPDVVLLPIGDYYTMDPKQAAMAIRLLGVRHVIPLRFGTFPMPVGTPDELKQLTKDISGLEIHDRKPGDTLA